MKHVSVAVILLLLVPVALCVQADPVEWRLIATEIDSETLSSNAVQNNVIIWSQAYARAREMTTYIDPATSQLHVLFNGGGSTSIYDLNKSTGSMRILVDGSASSKRALGRMVSLPDKNRLLVVDVSRFQVLVFALSSGAFLGSFKPFEAVSCGSNIGGLTLITPTLSLETDAIVWNEGSACILEVTLGADNTSLGVAERLFSGHDQVARGLVDIVEYPTSLFHLLYETCEIDSLYWTGAGADPIRTNERSSFQTGLDQKTSSSASTCNQMALHLGSLSYLVTSPTSQSVAVVNVTTRELIAAVTSPSGSEPYAISTAAWNEDLALIGAGLSVYGASIKQLVSLARKRSAIQLVWTDILPPSDYPIPDLSRIQQQPDAFGGGFYFLSSDKGFLLRPVASNSGNKFHVVRVDSVDSTFEALDALAYFPSQKCPQRAIGVTEAMVKTYISGITRDLSASVLMEYTGGGVPTGGDVLHKSSGLTQRLTSIDHHPFYPLLALGTSDGHVLFLDTNSGRVLKDFSASGRHSISSVSWLCSTSTAAELYVADTIQGAVLHYNVTYRGASQEPRVALVETFGPFNHPRNLVQDPTTGNYYVICDARNSAGVEAYLIANKTFSRVDSFTFSFSNLVYQKIAAVLPTTAQPVPRPSTYAALDQSLFSIALVPAVDPQLLGVPAPAPVETPEQQEPTSSPPSEQPVEDEETSNPVESTPEPETEAPEQSPEESPDQETEAPLPPTPPAEEPTVPADTREESVSQEPIPESEDVRVEVGVQSPSSAPIPSSQGKSATQENPNSIKGPMTTLLIMLAAGVVIGLVVLGIKRVQAYQSRKDWDAKRGKPNVPPTSEAELTRWAFAQHFNSRNTSGPKDALHLTTDVRLLNNEVDEEQAAAAMSRMPESSATDKLARMLKLAGVGLQSLVSRVTPPSGSHKPYYSMVDPAPDPSGIEISNAPAAPDNPKRLKVYQINVKNEHGVTFMRQTSSGSSSPAPAATPPRQHSPRRVASMKEAAANYSTAAERVSSAWPDGATVVVNQKTNRLQEEIDLSSSEDERLVQRTPKSSGQDRSLGDRVAGAFRGLFSNLPFRAASSASTQKGK